MITETQFFSELEKQMEDDNLFANINEQRRIAKLDCYLVRTERLRTALLKILAKRPGEINENGDYADGFDTAMHLCADIADDALTADDKTMEELQKYK